MDRKIVQPGAVPLETDLLGTNLYAMIGLGRLALDVIGSSTAVGGLACTPTSPASLTVNIGPGSIYSLQNIDNSAYSSIAADTTDQIVKQGIVKASDNLSLTMAAPTIAGQTVIYLIEAAFSEVDTDLTVLPFYNASTPSVPYSGPSGTGASTATRRAGKVSLQAKAGVAGTSPTAPSTDGGYAPLYYVTIPYGATQITSGMITVASGAPFLTGSMANLGSYLTIAAAASTYATIASVNGELANYLTTSAAASIYATIAQLSSYLTAAAASSTYAPSANAALTGTPTAPTAPASDNTTKIANTSWIWANIQALVANCIAMVATAAGFAFSAVANGYFKLPSWLGGFVIQWASGTISGSSQAMTFPTNFPTACYNVIAADSGTSPIAWGASAYSQTGFTLHNSGGSGGSYTYIAIGK